MNNDRQSQKTSPNYDPRQAKVNEAKRRVNNDAFAQFWQKGSRFWASVEKFKHKDSTFSAVLAKGFKVLGIRRKT